MVFERMSLLRMSFLWNLNDQKKSFSLKKQQQKKTGWKLSDLPVFVLSKKNITLSCSLLAVFVQEKKGLNFMRIPFLLHFSFKSAITQHKNIVYNINNNREKISLSLLSDDVDAMQSKSVRISSRCKKD